MSGILMAIVSGGTGTALTVIVAPVIGAFSSAPPSDFSIGG
jgi:hypothetical protein